MATPNWVVNTKYICVLNIDISMATECERLKNFRIWSTYLVKTLPELTENLTVYVKVGVTFISQVSSESFSRQNS